MIVPVSSEKYDNLFKEATQFLKEAKDKNGNKLFSNVDTIDSLNAYYGRMRDFYQAAGAHSDNRKGYKYIMMPLDKVGEDAFEINLNSRTITVPAAFSKIGGVQADQMAELIVFSVDRYFDYMDLANTLIYVQWQLPDNDHTTGATEITIKDLESAPGKIRFAWPLYNTITKHSGTVKFSVRFFVFDENDKLAYSLNTLDANLIIKPALDPADKIDPEPWGDLFTKAIINSQYTQDGQIPPVEPMFDGPGMDMTIMVAYVPVTYADATAFAADTRTKYVLNDQTNKYDIVTGFIDGKNDYFVEEIDFVRYLTEAAEAKKTQVAKLGSDDTLTLQAQAIVADSGTLTYQWKFQEDGKTGWEDVDAKYISTVAKPALLPVDPVTKKPYLDFREAYFLEDDQPFTGWEVPVDNDGNYDNSLYEHYTQLHIPPYASGDKDVVGTYVVVATNRISNMTKEKWSARCYLPGPSKIKFAENLYTVVKDADKKPSAIKVNLEEDINSPTITYLWFRDTLSETAAINKATKSKDLTSNEAITDMSTLTPGWYTARVIANLNRKYEVEGTPKAQVIYATPNIKAIIPAGGKNNTAFNIEKFQTQKLQVDVEVELPAGFTDASQIADALYRNLSYEWQYRRSDSAAWKNIVPSMVGNNQTDLIAAINDEEGSITVRNTEDMTAYQYRCIVHNTLGDQVATLALDDESLFLVY